MVSPRRTNLTSRSPSVDAQPSRLLATRLNPGGSVSTTRPISPYPLAVIVTITCPPGLTDAEEKDRMAAQVAGVTAAATDQRPSPAAVTARTCTSYWVPLVRPDIW